MNDHSNNGNFHNDERRYDKPATSTGEKRYGKPAAPSGGKCYGKPAAPSGEKRYGKPAAPSGEKRYGKPAAPSGEKRYGKPAAPSGEKRYGKPAAPSGEKRYGKPAAPSGEKRYGKPAAPSGERRFGKPAAPSGERHFGKPAAPSGEKRYGKPAAPSGERRFAKPAAPSGEKRYGKPAAPSGERRFAKPAAPSGEKRYGKPAAPSGQRRFARPAVAVPTESTGLSSSARRLALDVLQDVHQRGAYAALALQDRLSKSALKAVDKRLATSIVYSTLENQLKIDYALDKLMDHPTQDPIQRDILRLSACQIMFHDRVPDSAAVNEGVNLAKQLGMDGTTGFLNGVLRNLVRGKDEIEWPKREDGLREYLRIMSSTPLWIVDKLIAAYGEEAAEQILMYREERHEMVVRPNLMRLTDAQFEQLLERKTWTTSRGYAPHAYLVSGAVEIGLDNDYRDGLFSIEGQSSILAAEAVQVKPGMRVLDACAAPGGKACYMSETMQNTGRVFAWELHDKRALLLESAKRRLKLENLRITVRDATIPKPELDGTLDAVLLDAPCSGLGVMAQKPDLKYRLKEEDIPAIVETQKRLLNTLCLYVRPGGTLVYSTCSILPEENAEQLRAFLAEHEDFSIEPLPLTYPEALRAQQTALGLQLFGYRDGVEGFYIARLHRARA